MDQIRVKKNKNSDKFGDKPGPAEQPNSVVFYLPTTTKIVNV